MFCSDFVGYDLWWVFPVIMMVLCFFMMFRRRGSMMCGLHCRGAGSRHRGDDSDAGSDVPDKQDTRGMTSRESAKRK